MGDGYFYTLSAIAQSFAAIIALNGVFVLYKLQLLRSRRDELYARLQELWVEDLIDGSSYSRDHASLGCGSAVSRVDAETMASCVSSRNTAKVPAALTASFAWRGAARTGLFPLP